MLSIGLLLNPTKKVQEPKKTRRMKISALFFYRRRDLNPYAIADNRF